MDDLRERMDQLARRVDGAAAPDLQEVRQHRERRRTRSALVVGLCIALVGVFAASRLLRTEDPITPAAEGSLAVWPQDDGGAWQADPKQVVERFGQVVLGWTQPDIISYDPGVYEMRPEACPATARCTPSLTLTVEETTAGVWSVTSVTHPDLAIEVGLMDPRAALTPGAEISYDLDLPADRSAHVGVVASNGCREATAFEVGLGSGHHELVLPEATDDDPACSYLGSGYLFVYVTDDTTVPVGDPLREAAGIEYPWLTVVPIYLVMENEGETATATPALAEFVSVTCSDTGTSIEGDHVAAGPMGVAMAFEGVDDGYRLMVDGVPVLRDPDIILGLAPGSHRVKCLEGGDSEPFEVVDPEGYWVPITDLDCAQTEGSMGGYAGPAPVVDQDDLAFSAYEAVFPAADADVQMVPQGYAEDQDKRVFAAVRPDGTTIARVILQSIEEGWGVAATLVCA